MQLRVRNVSQHDDAQPVEIFAVDMANPAQTVTLRLTNPDAQVARVGARIEVSLTVAQEAPPQPPAQ